MTRRYVVVEYRNKTLLATLLHVENITTIGKYNNHRQQAIKTSSQLIIIVQKFVR